MKSKKILFGLLEKHFGVSGLDIGNHSISDETYGRLSMLYFYNINTVWGMSRGDFENLLKGWGFKVNPRWFKEADATEVQVSYFKGHHWDE